jgi:hypoxanthine phosphoribosyltransferase
MLLEDAEEIARQIGDRRYDLILAVARGGLPAATVLAHRLGVAEIRTVQFSSYGQAHTPSALRLVNRVDLPPGLRILVVDDILDRGATLEVLLATFGEALADADVAVLVRKPWSTVAPTFCARTTDAWVRFFWEREAPAER